MANGKWQWAPRIRALVGCIGIGIGNFLLSTEQILKFPQLGHGPFLPLKLKKTCLAFGLGLGLPSTSTSTTHVELR